MARITQSSLVNDIIEIIDKVTGYTDGFTFNNFAGQPMLIEACLYNIQIIGEAVSNLKEDTRQRSESIPWNLIKGMRGRLVNEQFEAEPEAVWEVVSHALPELKVKLERLYNRLVSRNL